MSVPALSFTEHCSTEIMNINPREFFDSSYTVGTKELLEFIQDNAKVNVFQGSKFIKTDYDDDKKKIIDFYNTQGYRDAEIVSDTVYAYNDNSINIDFISI